MEAQFTSFCLMGTVSQLPLNTDGSAYEFPKLELIWRSMENIETLKMNISKA
jgi:hypothetical protein